MDNQTPNHMPLSQDEAFKQKVKALIKSREQLKQQNSELVERISSLEAKIQDVSQQTGPSPAEMQQLEVQNARLQMQLQQYEAQMESMKNTPPPPPQNLEIELQKDRLDQLEKTNQQLHADLQMLAQQLMKAHDIAPAASAAPEPVIPPAPSRPAVPEWSSDLPALEPKLDEAGNPHGAAITEASADAERRLRDAEDYLAEVRLEIRMRSEAMVDDIDSAKAELRSIRASLSDLVNSFSGRLDLMANALDESKKYFLSRAQEDKE